MARPGQVHPESRDSMFTIAFTVCPTGALSPPVADDAPAEALQRDLDLIQTQAAEDEAADALLREPMSVPSTTSP